METKSKIAFFGSSVVSAYWNGAATYYRGIVKALSQLGHEVTFYEPDIYDRQKHRDIADPDYCKVVIYESTEAEIERLLAEASLADVIIKASGVGAFDDLLEAGVAKLKADNNLVIFWDVDAPATLDRINSDPFDPFNELIPKYDYILTYGGGQPVIDAYESKLAQKCIPVYNAFDAETHHPVPAEEQYQCDLAFLGNRLPDREARVEEFFLNAAEILPDKKFILGGSGWGDKALPGNANYVGHVYTNQHNAFNTSPLAVLNISRDSMAKYGFSPATRVFEAAGAGACIITDYWEGVDFFFEPGKEILIANNGEEVAEILRELTPERALEIGKAAYSRAMSHHTYNNRAGLLDSIFDKSLSSAEKIYL
ncbi:glycosyltransferase [Flavobacterium sp. J372]|uniref:CgeB family protein n=1 Tax=Flavobacterium sp. J372 TaxID=2898436 RepID=UPI0021519A0E|nr:glycosyltransferase [Flavobacterium sp. J372]MCR5862042.1 glycosyltransferase [Flavobacterium sp. J372]